MPIPSSDDSRPDTFNNRQSSRRISQEIANLQQDIRDDFDQKLRELSGLMHKFKSLLGNDGQLGSELPPAANQPLLDEIVNHNDTQQSQLTEQNLRNALADIPVLTDRVRTTDEADETVASPEKQQPAPRSAVVIPINKNVEGEPKIEPPTPATPDQPEQKPVSAVSRFSSEPARFETGLYQLNSQLYRFKLELDQELEYREEPLHIHFRHQSELAKVLQQITEKMQQERNVGR